jgi:glycosyltransferase involved in cell wall biosynthesis
MTGKAPDNMCDGPNQRRRLRVAMLTPSIGFGASFETPVICLLAESLATAVDLHLFPMHDEPDRVARPTTAFTIHRSASDGRFARRLAQTVRRIRDAHRREPFDLIHALWLHEPGTIAVVAGLALRLPVVASVGGAEVVSMPEINYGVLRSARGRWMTASVLQRSTLITAGSRYAVRMARRIVPHRDPARFMHVPLPIDVEAFAPFAEEQSGRLHLLHAASLIPVKDQATLIRAFREVVDEIPEATLTIAGEDPFGYRSELEALRDGLDLCRSVQFVGHQRHDAMPALYHGADLFVLSSRHESQAMVVCEAAAAGVPTVGTTVGVVADLAPDAAVAVRPGDPVALAEAIIGVLRDPGRRRQLGERARQRAAREYDATVVRDAFVGVYRDAIRRHGR